MSLFTDQASELRAALADTSKPTLVEFYATWCPHCQHMAPIVDDVRRRLAGKANVVTVDTEAHPELAQEFGVQSFPSWFVFKDGREVSHDTGEKPEQALIETVENA